MKSTTKILRFGKTLLFVAVAAVLAVSCTKQDSAKTYNYLDNSVTEDQKRLAEQVYENLPQIGFWDEDRSRLVTFDLNSRDFSFATPNDGWNFSNNDGVVYASDENGGIIIIPVPSFGTNTGGTVVAGSSAVDIDYTFCFSASDEALGLDLFDFGGDLDGISMVLGIGGDFEALANDELDDDSDFTDFFHGFAMYFVYDNEATGTYEVLDWFDDLEEDTDNLGEKGFSYVLDFVGEGLYFSTDGTIQVSGGDMTFSGEYLAITDFIFDFDDDFEPEFSIVSGFGTLGCN